MIDDEAPIGVIILEETITAIIMNTTNRMTEVDRYLRLLFLLLVTPCITVFIQQIGNLSAIIIVTDHC